MNKKTILIIDDERRMADSLRDLLTGLGYAVQVAYGGREGIDAIKRHTFNVIITDLRMQDVDGLEVIRYIHDHAPRTMVIVITGYASTESAIEAVHYQVFDYLRKPFDFTLLRMTVEKAFQRLETEQLREDTAAMITHDIKIPLTSIMGFAAMIYDRQREEFHPRAREFAETIQANGQKILSLIENYLTTCKIEAGTLSVYRTPTDLHRLVHDVIETTRIEAARKGRMIEQNLEPLPGAVDVDEPLVYRALTNLVNNALKYGRPEVPILVHACIAPPGAPLRGPALCLEVLNLADDLEPGHLAGVFQRYQRVQGRTSIEGSGIGLYVVQAIARAHGGDVAAELLSDGRVRFAIYLPLRSPDEAAGNAKDEHEPTPGTAPQGSSDDHAGSGI